MYISELQIIIIFVSTGRCGTKRLAEILDEALPKEEYAVRHQVGISRLANILGNVMYYMGSSEKVKCWIWDRILKKNTQKLNFISTDPLTAMVIPNLILNRKNTHIIHIKRDAHSFAESFFRFSRQRFQSFVAHNFVPFWQIGVWPLENILNPKIERKYQRVNKRKNDWFKTKYSVASNYIEISFKDIFTNNILKKLIEATVGSIVLIKNGDLKLKSNKSK